MTWVLDLDGVVWLAGEPIPGSPEAVADLRARGERVAFLTNNASATVEDYAERLIKAGVPATPDEVISSAQAAATLVEPGEAVFPCAGPGTVDALTQRGVRLVGPGEPADAAGLRWTFVRERQYTGLMLSRDPGAPIVWLGAALLAIGTCWTMFLRHQRLWLRLEPASGGTRVTVASPDRHDQAFSRTIHSFVAGLGDIETRR